MEKGMKFDRDKPRWELIPLVVIEEVVKVLTFGAKKYASNSWQSLEDAEGRYFAACIRHLRKYQDGEVEDEESGLPHLSHAMCNLVFLLWFELKKKEKRIRKGKGKGKEEEKVDGI